MSNVIQKLSCKANCKLPIFFIVILTFLGQLSLNPNNSFVSCCSFGNQHCTKGILGGMSTQSWDRNIFDVSTFTCSSPPHPFVTFAFPQNPSQVQHNIPNHHAEWKLQTHQQNSARSGFIVQVPFTHAKHELWIHAQKFLLLQLECVILLACTITSVSFD